MTENADKGKCPNCGTACIPNQLVCIKCGTLLFDPKSSTVHLRIDQSLLELRRQRKKDTGQLSATGRLVMLSIRGITERLSFEEGTEIVLGRLDLANPDMSRFDLSRYGGHERGVSREHAVLRYAEGKLSVTDLNSANGTMVNLARLEANQPRILKDGDELMLGSLTVRVRMEEEL